MVNTKMAAVLVAAMVVLGLADGAEAQVEVMVVTPAGYAAPATAGEQLASPPTTQLEVGALQVDGGPTRANRGLVVGGAVTFGGTYLANMLASVMLSAWTYNENSAEYMNMSLVPIAGPWIQLGYAATDAQIALGIMAGVAQAAGLAMFIAGLTVARSPVPEVQLGAGTRVTFTPTVTGDSAGLAALGTF